MFPFNKSKFGKLFVLLFLFSLCCYASDKNVVNPDDYPAADNKEWGHLQWVLKIAEQPINDFTNFDSVDEIGDSAKRYEIAFSGYLLGAEQYNKFPAWKGPLQNAYDRLIEKMIEKPVWKYWNKDSTGRPIYEPGLNSPEAASADPVGYRNIMYSGHLGMMIGQYEMLYNDLKYDKPGSIVFKWDNNTEFVYDNKSLQEVMFMQMITNSVPGIECEPNAIFAACNQHPILSWKHYDYIHGTRYFPAASPLFAKWFSEEWINSETHQIAIAYFIKSKSFLCEWNPNIGNKLDAQIQSSVKSGKLSLDSPANDGWVGTFMHAWNPEIVNLLYPYMRKNCIIEEKNGREIVKLDKFSEPDYFGFFTMFAAEMGDEETKNKLLQTADELFSPIWVDGTFHYPFNDNVAATFGPKKKKKVDNNDLQKQQPAPAVPMGSFGTGDCCKKSYQNSNLQDRMLALARALPPNGLWKMYNEPFDKQHFSEPAITDVDIKALKLKRAVYDRTKKALIVSTLGSDNNSEASFRMINLKPEGSYLLADNESVISKISGVKEYNIKLNNKISHDFILSEEYIEK